MHQTSKQSATLLCGLSYFDVIAVAEIARNKADAARKLGVSLSTLREVIKKRGMGHWFKREVDHSWNKRMIAAEDIDRLAGEGLTLKDAAEAAGYEYTYFNSIVRSMGKSGKFPNRGKASWIARRGYAV